MRTLFTIGATLLVAAATIFVAAPGAHAATVSVDVQDFVFNPSMVNIQVGDEVEWTFVGQSPHNVTANDASFASADLLTGTFARTFDTAGSFAYYCTFHGTAQGQGMAGAVVVAAAAAPTATNTAQSAGTPTRTATRTPQSTTTPQTPVATATPGGAATPTPIEVIPIGAPGDGLPSSTGGAAPQAVGAPNAGAGPGDTDTWWYWLAVVLAVLGALSVGSALTLARSGRR
ncbi:MAG: plastocyanin/azurin family copper-binding protein [Dehalococcoidia bacterium]